MIISTIEELRLYSPSNAIDNFESIIGFLDSSEQDTLREKLGNELYDSLVEYYNKMKMSSIDEFISFVVSGEKLTPYATLLKLSQKIVTYDTLRRYIDLQTVSTNGSGVNVASADDYKPADMQRVAAYKKGCSTEMHTAINCLLQQLEEWTKKSTPVNGEQPTNLSDDQEEIDEIVEMWRKSKYFFLSTKLLIPTAVVLNDYSYKFYDNRERFIQMLPDLNYIQEDIIMLIFGSEFIEYLVDVAASGTNERNHCYIIHHLRKIMAKHCEYRQLKTTDQRYEASYNEAVKITERLVSWLQSHQEQLPEPLKSKFTTSPLYVVSSVEPKTKKFSNNSDGSKMFVTPYLK